MNLNKRLAFVGVSEGLKAIIGKFSDATTFEDYRAQLFNDVLPNSESSLPRAAAAVIALLP